MTSEKQFRKELWEHYKRNSEKTKKMKDVIGGVYTDEEIKGMIDIDIKNWKEAIKKRDWGFRLCTGARCFLKPLTNEEKIKLGVKIK